MCSRAVSEARVVIWVEGEPISLGFKIWTFKVGLGYIGRMEKKMETTI